jgi:hypothetical protein
MAWTQSSGLSVYSQSDFLPSARFDQRRLEYQSTTVIDWANGYMYSPSNGSISLDFKNRQLLDSASQFSVDWGSRVLSSSGGVSCFDWGNDDGVRLIGEANNLDYGPIAPKLALAGGNYAAPITAFNTQRFTPTTGNTITLGITAGNDILIVIEPAGTLANLTINIINMLDELIGGGESEARIQIFSTKSITTLTLTTGAYTLVGAPITTIAANGQHTLRLSSQGATKRLYHVV